MNFQSALHRQQKLAATGVTSRADMPLANSSLLGDPYVSVTLNKQVRKTKSARRTSEPRRHEQVVMDVTDTNDDLIVTV